MKRFHLSTLLLLTVLAGAFVGANCIVRLGQQGWSIPEGVNQGWCNAYGWPIAFTGEANDNEPYWFDGFALLINVVVGLAILYCATSILQNITRRKQAD